ncbi:MAG: hypothetical protein HYV96_14655 [Opitutae bacterium]|nr:hypothetical protein [Opitutae bacterium]
MSLLRRSFFTLLFFVPVLAALAAAEKTGPLPDNPNLIEPGRRLYTYLYELSRSDATTGKLISGHWFQSSFSPGKIHTFQVEEALEIRRHTGKWVGLLDGWICPDFVAESEPDPIAGAMWYDDMIPEYVLWWRNGGIVHADATFAAPLADRYAPRLEKGLKVDVASVLTPGTPANRRWRAICDRMSVFFKGLEAQNVPVVFRPFTEAYLAHFWYSNAPRKLGNEGFIRLYRDLHDYLTLEKKCNNILWEFQGGKADPHYPGDAYVDVYGSRSEYVAWKIGPFQKQGDDDIPQGNAELGDYGVSKRADQAGKPRISWLTWVETIKRQCPRLAFYITWNKEWGPTKRVGPDDTYCDYDRGYDALIAHDYVLTRDEISVTPKPPALTDGVAADRWIVSRGRWSFDATAAQVDAADEGRVLYGNTDWTDYAVQATVAVPANGESGILGRCASTNIFYHLAVSVEGVTLYRRHNHKLDKLGTWAHTFRAGEDCTLKLDFRGDRLEGYVDLGAGAEKRISVNDDRIPCGCVGLRAVGTAASFTNIQVVP